MPAPAGFRAQRDHWQSRERWVGQPSIVGCLGTCKAVHTWWRSFWRVLGPKSDEGRYNITPATTSHPLPVPAPCANPLLLLCIRTSHVSGISLFAQWWDAYRLSSVVSQLVQLRQFLLGKCTLDSIMNVKGGIRGRCWCLWAGQHQAGGHPVWHRKANRLVCRALSPWILAEMFVLEHLKGHRAVAGLYAVCS